ADAVAQREQGRRAARDLRPLGVDRRAGLAPAAVCPPAPGEQGRGQGRGAHPRCAHGSILPRFPRGGKRCSQGTSSLRWRGIRGTLSMAKSDKIYQPWRKTCKLRPEIKEGALKMSDF